MTTIEQKFETLIGKLQGQLIITVQINEELQAKVHELQTELDMLKPTEENTAADDSSIGNSD